MLLRSDNVVVYVRKGVWRHTPQDPFIVGLARVTNAPYIRQRRFWNRDRQAIRRRLGRLDACRDLLRRVVGERMDSAVKDNSTQENQPGYPLRYAVGDSGNGYATEAVAHKNDVKELFAFD